MPQPLHVLIAEDNLDDAKLVVRELRRAGFEPEWHRVEDEEGFLAGLDRSPDLILSDYSMPEFDGLRALELVRQRGLSIPFIIVSGTIGEEMAVAAMKKGASDYLLKDRLARLGSAVRHVLEQRKLLQEQQKAQEALRLSEERF